MKVYAFDVDEMEFHQGIRFRGGGSMTEEELFSLLKPHLEKNPEGIFPDGEFDLDIRIPSGEGFSLWLDGVTKVELPGLNSREDAEMVQRVVEKLGRRLLHTWGMQYSEES